MKKYGLDLSEHNGSLDFQAIKNAGNDFVILRCGYGSESTQKDTHFEYYYTQAKKVGLHVGAYLYSYALNTEEALAEAKQFCEWLKGKQFDMPVYYDMEDADGYKKKHGMPSNATLSAMCQTFCSYMEKQGYYVGIYASESWLKNQLALVVSKNKYNLWCANWGTNNGTLQSDKSSAYRLHQFTSMYSLSGKRLDRNVLYYDYPTLLKERGFNGYKGGSVIKPTKKTIEELANEVIKGLWGNGAERVSKLTQAGYDANAVQNKVNEKLGVKVKSIDTLAREVIQGKWGNGAERVTKLTQAGYNATAVQKRVNEML
jgi:GH25 family lysozyme M1 (1,4-beta-N-acetylmuramidase)